MLINAGSEERRELPRQLPAVSIDNSLIQALVLLTLLIEAGIMQPGFRVTLLRPRGRHRHTIARRLISLAASMSSTTGMLQVPTHITVGREVGIKEPPNTVDTVSRMLFPGHRLHND